MLVDETVIDNGRSRSTRLRARGQRIDFRRWLDESLDPDDMGKYKM